MNNNKIVKPKNMLLIGYQYSISSQPCQSSRYAFKAALSAPRASVSGRAVHANNYNTMHSTLETFISILPSLSLHHLVHLIRRILVSVGACVCVFLIFIFRLLSRFTLYPANSRDGRGSLVLRHSIFRFPLNSGGLAC